MFDLKDDLKPQKSKFLDFETFYKTRNLDLSQAIDYHVFGSFYHIYSPTRIRLLAQADLPWYFKEDMPKEIQALCTEADKLTDTQIQTKINKYYIHKAIRVMSAYKGGSIPLTNRPNVKTTPINLLSKKGEKVLTHLINAAKVSDYSDKTAYLALRGAHKFLMDTSYYRDFNIDGEFLLQKNDTLTSQEYYTFPSIQLTEGCYYNCSHCMAQAVPDNIAHMPYPMFVKIFEELWPQYKKYPFLSGDNSFSKHFDGSDPLVYQDNIIGADYGDIVAFLYIKHSAPNSLLTKGIRTKKSKLALAKVLISTPWPLKISFVDTPKENMANNIKNLKETLDIVKSTNFSKGRVLISHLTLKSGSSVSDEIFEDFYVTKSQIFDVGRANQFPDSELYHPLQDDNNVFVCPIIIGPNGDIVSGEISDRKYIKTKKANLFDNPFKYRHQISFKCKRILRDCKRKLQRKNILNLRFRNDRTN